jgi:hypothetical protein
MRQHRSLDLTSAGVSRHWMDKGVASLIQAMERCEPWAVDVRAELKSKAESVVIGIADQFNGVGARAIETSVRSQPALMIDFMGYLRSGRALALLAWLTDVHSAIPGVLIDEARRSSDGYGLVLIERIVTLEKQHLLSRVFSPERIALVTELLAETGLGGTE